MMTKKGQDTSGDETTSRLVDTGLREVMLEKLPKKELRHGDFLYKIGDRVDGFFIVQAGALEVLREGEVVRTLKVGDLVGERQYFEESDKRLQCTKPRNETVRAEADTVVSHLTADQLNLVILNSKEAGIKLIHYYARLAIQAENRLAVNQQANKDLAKATAQSEKAIADANTKLSKAMAEIAVLTERNEGQARSLGLLQEENGQLEETIRTLHAKISELKHEIDGLNSDLITANHELAERQSVVLQAQETGRHLREMKQQVGTLQAELDEARQNELDAMTQLGDEQQAKVAAQAALYELEQAVNARVAAAHDAQAALYEEYCKRQDEVIKALRLRNNELRDDRNQLRGTRTGTHTMSRQDINLSEILTALEEYKATLLPTAPPSPPEATPPDAEPGPIALDPPSDTLPNPTVREPEEEPALELDLNTFVGKPPTKPAAEPEPPTPNRFDEPTGRIGLEDIEVIGTTSPKKPA